MTHRALIAVGSNLGDRLALIDAAIAAIAACDSITVLRQSTWRETIPVGETELQRSQPNFMNGAVLLETSLTPEALLATLLAIESSLGRQRNEYWGPRFIDLDLLLYDEMVLHTPRLELPHPRMAVRRFVLEPAAEIAPDMRHPISGTTLAELWQELAAKERE